MVFLKARDRIVWLVAVSALLSGAVSAGAVAVAGNGDIGGAFARDQLTIYGPAHAALSIALAVGGLLLLVLRQREAVAALLGTTGMCAAQLAGAGLVGYRRWPLYWGCCSSGAVTEQSRVRMLAVAMALACAVSAVACIVVLWRRFPVWQGWVAALAFPVALVVAVAVPRLMAGAWSDGRDLAAGALTYSLPFAAALASSALMGRFAALALAVAVACSAVMATVGQPFLESRLPFRDSVALVVAAAVAVAVSRLIPAGQRVGLESTPPTDRTPSP